MLRFPFENIRRGQKQFYDDTLKTIDANRTLMAYAPTGIGKTAAVLSAALEKQLDNPKSMIFFLTSRHSQHNIAVETLKKIHKINNININVVDIINKMHMCPARSFDMGRTEFESYCYKMRRKNRCKYGKINPLAVDALSRDVYHVEEAIDVSKIYGSCPYFTSLSRLKKADVVICDYSYIFDPGIREVILGKVLKQFNDFIIIIDEAHNLPGRIRDYGSCSLTPGVLGASKKIAKEILKDKFLSKQINVLLTTLKTDKESELKKNDLISWVNQTFSQEFIGDVTYDSFLIALQNAAEEVRIMTSDPMPNVIDSLVSFFSIWEVDLKDYVRIIDPDGVHMIPLNIASLASDVFDYTRSCILMSATLYPQQMYADILGIKEPVIKSYVSPFPEDNRLITTLANVSTVYRQRNKIMFSKYAQHICNISKNVPGNVAVFFPSYDLMEKVSEIINTEFNSKLSRELVLEKQCWNKNEKSQLVHNVEEKDNFLLFFVQGASFAEGIDFKNNSLKCIMIVGLPVAPPSILNQKLLEFYDKRFAKGYEYVYILPAFNRVLQSSGRAIRKSSDICSIILMDSRFNYPNYKRYLPGWNIKRTTEPAVLINDFFKYRNKHQKVPVTKPAKHEHEFAFFEPASKMLDE